MVLWVYLSKTGKLYHFTVMVRVSMIYQARINRVKVSVRFRVRFRFSDRLT